MLKTLCKNNIEEEVEIDKEFVGVIRSPEFLYSSTPYKDNFSPPTQKAVLIIPGKDEDYNSTRIRSLASFLSSKLGLYSLRIKVPNNENQNSWKFWKKVPNTLMLLSNT